MTNKYCAKKGARALMYALMLGAAAVCALPENSRAMLVPAQAAAPTDGQGYDRAADMKTIQTALESKMIRGRLKSLGLSDKEAESRLNRLSDKEVHQLAKDINTLSPGGDVGVGGFLVLAILILLVIFLVQRI